MNDLRAKYGSIYINLSDVEDSNLRLVISECREEQFQEGNKDVLKFKDSSQRLVLNKTRGRLLAQAFGWDSDAWGGKAIEIFKGTANSFSGGQVDSVMVRALETPVHVQAPLPKEGQPTDLNDDIPF